MVERLGTDPEGRRALVRLADQRYALTGPTAVVGPARKIARYLRWRRLELTGEDWFSQARDLLRRATSKRPAPPLGRP